MIKWPQKVTNASAPDWELVTCQSLIRLGNERGLLMSDWPVWKTYRQARTDSSHTYDAAKAEAEFKIAQPFLGEAQQLLQNLLVRQTTD